MYEINLVKLPRKVLREKSLEVPIPLSDEDIELAEKMIYHVDDSQKPNTKFRPAVGVAAVQYGILKRVFYIHVKDYQDRTIFRDVLFNPVVLNKTVMLNALAEGEGCLSVDDSWPNQEGFIHRANRIVVKAYSYFQQKEVTYDVSDYVAIVMQHELDHLDGKLFIDHINKKHPWRKKEKCKYL